MIHLQRCSYNKKEIIRHLVQFYFYDLASNSKLASITYQNGHYQNMPYFDNYWSEEQRYPYLIYQNETIVGFALVHPITINESIDWKLAEFFVMKPFGRQGIGQKAFKQLLSLHQGNWEISVLRDNKPACHFWKKILDKTAKQVKHESFQNFIYYETSLNDKW